METVGGDRSRRLTRAERKAGELLQQLERSNGGRPAENPSQPVTSSEYSAVLEESDINRMTAHRWQTVAQVPDVDPTKVYLCRAIVVA